VRTSVWILPLAALGMAACATGPAATRPAAENEAPLAVYLGALPPGGAAPGFRLEALRAVGEDGSTIELSLRLRDVDARSASRERLLGWGAVPEAEYVGLELQTGRPSDPAPPVRVPISVRVTRGHATVVALRADPAEPPDTGDEVSVPGFTAGPPPRPPTGLLGVVISRAAGVMTLFDRVSGRVAAIVPVGREPSGLALDPVRRRAYVTLAGDDAVAVVDLEQQVVIDQLRLGGGTRPADLVLAPDGSMLVVVNAGANSVSLVDALSLVEIDRIGVGDGPASALFDPDGRRVFVFNALSSSITVIDVVARSVWGTFATEAGPLRGQLDVAARKLYVIHTDSPNLLVFDAYSLAVLSRVYVGVRATDILRDPRTRRIYVARAGTGTVEVFDPASLLPVDSVRTDADVAHMALDEEQHNLWLVLPRQGTARAVRIGGGRVAELDLGERPERVALMGQR